MSRLKQDESTQEKNRKVKKRLTIYKNREGLKHEELYKYIKQHTDNCDPHLDVEIHNALHDTQNENNWVSYLTLKLITPFVVTDSSNISGKDHETRSANKLLVLFSLRKSPYYPARQEI